MKYPKTWQPSMWSGARNAEQLADLTAGWAMGMLDTHPAMNRTVTEAGLTAVAPAINVACRAGFVVIDAQAALTDADGDSRAYVSGFASDIVLDALNAAFAPIEDVTVVTCKADTPMRLVPSVATIKVNGRATADLLPPLSRAKIADHFGHKLSDSVVFELSHDNQVHLYTGFGADGAALWSGLTTFARRRGRFATDN